MDKWESQIIYPSAGTENNRKWPDACKAGQRARILS